MKEIVVTSSLIKSTEYKMNLALMLQGKMARRLFTFAFLPAIFIITLLKEVWFPPPPHSSPNNSLYGLCAFLFFALFFFGIPYLKTYRRKVAPVYTFDNWGVRITVGDITTNLQWRDIRHYTDVSTYIVINLKKGLLNNEIISKADFKTRDEWQQVLDMLDENGVKSKAIVR